MKKIPQTDQLTASGRRDSDSVDDNGNLDDLPMMPGTELPRSLGDMMRQAAEQQASDSATPVPDKSPDRGRSRRSGKPSRSQQRRYARERALQALYQWDVSAGESSAVRSQFMDEQDMSRVDVDYFVKLFNGVSHNPDKVDLVLATALDRELADLDPVERSVLRLATFELIECLDVPARVVINEGIEISKRFGADKGFHYINGVLDKLARETRPLEMNKR